MGVIMGILIDVIHDGFMNIQTNKIRGGQRSHGTPSKGAENSIDIVNTAVIFEPFRIPKRLIDKLETNAVAKESRRIFNLHNSSN